VQSGPSNLFDWANLCLASLSNHRQDRIGVDILVIEKVGAVARRKHLPLTTRFS